MMTVTELIEQLQKVKTKTATVFMNNSDKIENVVERAIIEHDLSDDEVVVVLKPCD